MKTKKKTLKTIGTLAIVGILGFGAARGVTGISAYMEDGEEVINTFVVGEVSLSLTEPSYPGNDLDAVKNQVPHQETAKNPTVTNTGENDEVVFIRMTVPVKSNIVTVNADGTKNTPANSELYYFKKSTDASSVHANNFNLATASADGWIELTEKEEGTTLTGTTRTYVFGYSKALQGLTTYDGDAQTTANKVTVPLFDKIQLYNVLEGAIPSNQSQNIIIQAYGIQADEIIQSGSVIDTSSTLSKNTLNYIYDVYVNQNTTN
jgi:hypothetical protein